MEAKTNYTLVGVIVLVLSAALLSAMLWLSVGFNQKTYVTYTVYLHEAAAGLSEDSAVKYNGVQVGFVKKIKLNKRDPRQVEILLDIQEGTPITTSTSATLISQGITGVSYMGLSAGSSDLTPLKRVIGEPYPVIPAKPSLFDQLDSILKQVSENVGKLSASAEKVFSEENTKHFQQTLTNIDQFSKVIANNSENINRSLRSTDVILANMAKVSKDFPDILKELKIGVEHLSRAGNDVSETMISGKSAIDIISQQTVPPAIQLIRKLNSIAANLEQVSNDMRLNPSVVIRGTKPPKPGPGE